MAIEIGRKALSKLSGFLSSAKISRCVTPPNEKATGGLGVRGPNSGTMEAEFDEIERNNDWQRLYGDLRLRTTPNPHSPDSGNLFAEAKKGPNRKLNRYTDVLAFEHTRVKLCRGTVHYINANHLIYERARRSYILTQGPVEESVGHFWLMVWEQRSPIIVMLNKIIEKQRIKCHKYWPEADEPLEIEELQLTVELVSEDETETYVRRTMRLSDSKSGDSRIIVQFQYTEWPDFGVPNSPDDFLLFLELVRGSGLLSGSSEDKEKGPPVIHCSAGIGRSGTFCLVDLVLKMLEDGTVKDNGDINVQQILLDLRQSRVGLIQTHEQLRFVYVALIEAAKRRRGESSSGPTGVERSFNTGGAKDTKEAMETEQAGCNGDIRHRGVGRRPPADNSNATDKDDDDREVIAVATNSVGAIEQGSDEEIVELPPTVRGGNSKVSQTTSTDDRTATADKETQIEGKRNSNSNEHMNTNGPELEAETTQEEAGEQRDEELQTEAEESAEEVDEASNGSGGEDEGSSPQKRAHHRLSLNNSDLKEEPILKRTKSQDE